MIIPTGSAPIMKLSKVMESHPFGPKNHFTIWYKGKRGVNGHCLLKDTKAMAHYSKLELINKVYKLNAKYTKNNQSSKKSL